MTADKLVLGRAFAPAKINLALHVTGRRADGYHDLDSLVVFADIGDVLEADAAPPGSGVSLAIDGPFGAELDGGEDNLILRAVCALKAAGATLPDCRIRLTKNLPIASGIGGGSADAAATLRLMNPLADHPLGADELATIASTLGADVPMCLRSVPLRARGTGTEIETVAGLPPLFLVLANPGVAVSTPAVFRRLANRDNPPMPERPPRFPDAEALSRWLATTRNDLEAPAMAEALEIAAMREAVSGTTGNLLTRMSGSGATIFGIYSDAAAADAAVRRLSALWPDAWIVGTGTGGRNAWTNSAN